MPTTFKSTLLPWKLIITTIRPLVAMAPPVLAENMVTATILALTTTTKAAVAHIQLIRTSPTRLSPVRLLPI